MVRKSSQPLASSLRCAQWHMHQDMLAAAFNVTTTKRGALAAACRQRTVRTPIQPHAGQRQQARCFPAHARTTTHAGALAHTASPVNKRQVTTLQFQRGRGMHVSNSLIVTQSLTQPLQAAVALPEQQPPAEEMHVRPRCCDTLHPNITMCHHSVVPRTSHETTRAGGTYSCTPAAGSKSVLPEINVTNTTQYHTVRRYVVTASSASRSARTTPGCSQLSCCAGDKSRSRLTLTPGSAVALSTQKFVTTV